MRDKDLKLLEDDLLVLCLDNCSIYLFSDDRHYTDSCRSNLIAIDSPGKTSTWYACRLKVGSRTFMRITKQACAKKLLEERRVMRHHSFVRLLELTPLGEKTAKRLKAERNDEFPEPEEDPLIKVRVRSHSPHAQEEPILVMKEKCLSSLIAVTILREKTDNEEYIITKSDTIVVTIRDAELPEGKDRKVLVKGIELKPSLYERIKRLVLITLNDEDLQFSFVPHTPLPYEFSNVKKLRTNLAQKMLKQWNCFKKTSCS